MQLWDLSPWQLMLRPAMQCTPTGQSQRPWPCSNTLTALSCAHPSSHDTTTAHHTTPPRCPAVRRNYTDTTPQDRSPKGSCSTSNTPDILTGTTINRDMERHLCVHCQQPRRAQESMMHLGAVVAGTLGTSNALWATLRTQAHSSAPDRPVRAHGRGALQRDAHSQEYFMHNRQPQANMGITHGMLLQRQQLPAGTPTRPAPALA